MSHPPPPPAHYILLLEIPSRSKPLIEATTFLLVFEIRPTTTYESIGTNPSIHRLPRFPTMPTTSQFLRSNPSIMEAQQPCSAHTCSFSPIPIIPAMDWELTSVSDPSHPGNQCRRSPSSPTRQARPHPIPLPPRSRARSSRAGDLAPGPSLVQEVGAQVPRSLLAGARRRYRA